MRRVTGIGGVFFQSADPAALTAWYEKHLGISFESYGALFLWSDGAETNKVGSTAFSIFPRKTEYFEPTVAPFMLNFRVENLQWLLEQLEAEGVWIDPKRDDSFGHFAWIRDPDGNRIELWEPPEED